MNKERFFGIHFDFHASNSDEVGANTRPEEIEWYINATKPDFIQCDCKGHAGNCCYPTKVGKPADKLMADNLKVWVETAHKHNIPIYVHYSGVIDDQYVKAHPEQAAVKEDGTIGNKTSLFGTYVDDLLIPQMKEMIDEYGIDGAWIDGECWAVNRDYSPLAKKHIPEGTDNVEYNRLMREAFYKYVAKYIDELHEYKPGFMITSNWMYSRRDTTKPKVNIDFISGDFSPSNSAHSARIESRCIPMQDKPWDLMAWSFNHDWACGTRFLKPAVQLEQEAAIVLSNGGGFQVYIAQNWDGSARPEKTDRLEQLSKFMRQRKMNFSKNPIAQVGIYFSHESRFIDSADDPCVFSATGCTNVLDGLVHCTLDAQYTTNVVLQYKSDTLPEYDIVIVPEWKNMSDEEKATLIKYAENGGNLVIDGAKNCSEFGKLVGENFGTEDSDYHRHCLWENGLMTIYNRFVDLKKGSGKLFYGAGNLGTNADKTIPAYRIDTLGKGKIAYIPFSLGTQYLSCKSFYTYDYLHGILAELSRPVVELNARNIDMTLQKTENGAYLNLINMNQNRHDTNYQVFDEVPPVFDLEVVINKPIKNISMPLGEEFEVLYEKKRTIVKLKKLEIHSIIELPEFSF